MAARGAMCEGKSSVNTFPRLDSWVTGLSPQAIFRHLAAAQHGHQRQSPLGRAVGYSRRGLCQQSQCGWRWQRL